MALEPIEIQAVNIREVWPGEARDFTPWMADNLDVLGEHLGFGELALEATEVPIPDGRALDVLAIDTDGRKWSIENQYGVGDHDHLTRGLAYAVALECRALVIVAEGHREEFVAVADEWNRYSEAFGPEGIRLFLAVIEAWKIGDSAPGYRFRHIAGPNEWKAAARSSVGKTAAQAERNEANHQFWSEFLPIMNERSKIFRSIGPRTGPWLGVSTGDFNFQVWVKSDACHVQIRIDTGDAYENAALFDDLAQERERIDADFGPGLDWNRADTHRACFVRFDVSNSCGWKTPADERAPGLICAADAMARLHKVFDPVVSQIS